MYKSNAMKASRHDHVCCMQLWRHAIHYVAEVVLEGIARVKSRCSTIGRNAMSAGSPLLVRMHVAAAWNQFAALHVCYHIKIWQMLAGSHAAYQQTSVAATLIYQHTFRVGRGEVAVATAIAL